MEIYSSIPIEYKCKIRLHCIIKMSEKCVCVCVFNGLVIIIIITTLFFMCLYECATAVSGAHNFASIAMASVQEPSSFMTCCCCCCRPNFHRFTICILPVSSDALDYFIRLLIKKSIRQICSILARYERFRHFAVPILSGLRDVLVFMARFIRCNFNITKNV